MPSGSALSGGPLPGLTTVDLTGQTAVSLTTDQMKWSSIAFTGTLSADCAVTWPLAATENAGFVWDVSNRTTGNFRVLCQGPSGAQIAAPQGSNSLITWTGANMEPTDSAGIGIGLSPIVINGNNPATTVLTRAQAAALVLQISGTATGTVVVQVPNGVHAWIVENQLGVTVVVQMATGTSAQPLSGTSRWVYADGVNCNLASAA